MQEPWEEAPKCVQTRTDQSWVPGEVEWEPRPLKGGLLWSHLRLETKQGMEQFKAFLDAHYVRGTNYGLHYDEHVLAGANMPPIFHPDWHVAVRNKKGAIMATVTAVPADFVHQGLDVTHRAIINFLCVHSKLRHKRLAPVLIQEVTRRIAAKQVWEAIYTAVADLPRPIASPNYKHIPIDVPYLRKIRFIDHHVPRVKLTNHSMTIMKVQDDHIPHLFTTYQRYITTTNPKLALHFKSIRQFKHEIAGPHKYALVTQDMNNFATFVLITSTHLQHKAQLKAAYLTFCLATSMPHTTFFRLAASMLPAHLLNILTSTTPHDTHAPLHTHTPLHFFTYNSTHARTHFLPFAFT